MSRALKRKSGPSDYASDEGFVANDSDDSNPPTKKTKTKSSHFTSAHQALTDSDGNPYWELSKMRRVTVSEFKGRRMINIREYYEKDGKDLPGKKGISMTLEQYSTLVQIIPEIERVLKNKGEDVPRSVYADHPAVPTNESEQATETGKADSDRRDGKKRNIEETSDEDE